VGRGAGGPNLAMSSSNRFLIRLGVTGNTVLPLIGAGGLVWLEFGLSELVESLDLTSGDSDRSVTSSGHMVLIEGKINSFSTCVLCSKLDWIWAKGGGGGRLYM